MADVVIAGAAGRMGSRLVALLQDEPGLRLVAALEAPGHAALRRGRRRGRRRRTARRPHQRGSRGRRSEHDRILIEFSVPDASLAHLRVLARKGGRAVIGTTGFSAAQKDEVEDLARHASPSSSPPT